MYRCNASGHHPKVLRESYSRKWMLWDLQKYMHNFPFSLANIRTLWPSETGFELFLA